MTSVLRPMPEQELKKHIEYEINYGMAKLKRLQGEWQVAENIYQAILNSSSQGGVDADTALSLYLRRQPEANQRPFFNTVIVARAMFFLHSKLCITEPTVVAVPLNRDYSTKKRAELAQDILEGLREEIHLQDVVEGGVYVDIVTKGNGCLYTGWDPTAGKVINFDENSGKIDMTGDFCVRSVNMSDFFPQSSATNILDVDSAIERVWMDVRKATFEYPEIEEYLEEIVKKEDTTRQQQSSGSISRSSNTIPVYHYWEKGQAYNGMLGRHVVFVIKKKADKQNEEVSCDDICILHVGENPLPHKDLPFSFITDLDIRTDVYGMSRATHVAHHVDTANAFMTATIESIELHGLPRLVAPEQSTDKSIGDNDIAKVMYYNPTSGGQVYHLKPTPVTSDIWRMMEILEREVDMMYGQNEFSKGEVNRELSSYAVQIGIEMDDKYRIRLFNKKKMFLQRVYSQLLVLAQHFVKTPRKAKLVGRRNMYKQLYWSDTDLQDVDSRVEYGKYMPIDPSAKKQMILEMINSGAFERAGGNPAKLFKIIVDGDMLDMTDVFEASKEIQDSEIAAMLTGEEVTVQPWHDHPAHMEQLQDFMQTADFELLPEKPKRKVWEHYTTHETEFAKLQAKAQTTKTPPGMVPGAEAGGSQTGNVPAAPQGGEAAPLPPNAQGV